MIGENADLTYTYDYLGAGPDSLARLIAGEGDFYQALKAAKRPLIIVGQGALLGANGLAILSAAARLAADVGAVTRRLDRPLGPPHRGLARRRPRHRLRAGRGRARRRGRCSRRGKALDVLFLLGADEIDVPDGAFVVYLGTHGDAGAHRADVILPGAAYTEKSGTWVNTEGRVQLGNRAAFPPGDAREDWSILRALSGVLGKTLPFDSLAQLRAALYARIRTWPKWTQSSAAERADFERLAALGGSISGPAFASPIRDFYLTNPIARASAGPGGVLRHASRPGGGSGGVGAGR